MKKIMAIILTACLTATMMGTAVLAKDISNDPAVLLWNQEKTKS